MKSHTLVPLVFLATFSGVLIWRAGDDDQRPKNADGGLVPVTGPSVSGVVDRAPHLRVVVSETPESPTANDPVSQTDPWPNTDVVNTLRAVYSTYPPSPAIYRAAIAHALPALATDQDAQLLVGNMLVGVGDPVDGLAWQLLACMNCTAVDERIGHGCAAEGLCDPNLALVDVFRRDYGEQMTDAALVRLEEIKARIALGDPSALAIVTEIDDARFPRAGECVQLRTPTPECPPQEILRQTGEPQNINGRIHDTQPHLTPDE